MRAFVISLMAITLGLAFQRAEAAEPILKQLIEFGWDEPDTAFMREHLDQLEKSPFDGCVFHVEYTATNGSKGNFTWEAWGTRAFTLAELKPAIDNLKATPFRRFKHNFLRFNTTPAKLDWFDDYSAVLTNAQLAAHVAREGRCPGLLFDIEQYDGLLFNYRKQRDQAKKTWDQYAAQVRQRGREVMDAFQKGYPGLTVFLTFGYCLPWAQCGGTAEKLPQADYGLLAPFLDGMVEAARGDTKLVDGHELSYGFKESHRFPQAFHTMEEKLLPIVAEPAKYHEVFSFAFGLWMDHDWRKTGWDTNDLSRNHFTPETFEASVRTALEVADEYVWIYTETPRWWSKDGKPVKLPQPYAAAVRRARERPPASRR